MTGAEGTPNLTERQCGLLFELSSPERMAIMLDLKKDRLSMSQISRKLDHSMPETSRHLQRLEKAGLIRKGREGLFELSQFGGLSLALLSGLGFLSDNVEYFSGHDLTRIPYEFVDRIGELRGSRPGTSMARTLEETEETLSDAQEFAWIMSDGTHQRIGRLLLEKTKKAGFDTRGIFAEDTPSLHLFPPGSGVQRRVLANLDVLVVATEKAARFALPNSSGKFEYGFSGTDPRFLKWCKDLFLYYWERANRSSL